MDLAMAGRRGALQWPKGLREWCGFLWLVARMQAKREVATTPRHSILHLTVGAQQARGYSANASGWRASAHEGEATDGTRLLSLQFKMGMPTMAHSRDSGCTVEKTLLELNTMSPFSTDIGTAEQTYRIVQGTRERTAKRDHTANRNL